jgi:predicted nucleic acid-binding protein
VILVDSNIPMYLVGADHPHKHDAQRLLDTAISRREALVTDAEVLQEILHRYGALRRLDAIQPAFDALLAVVEEVLPVTAGTVESAKRFMHGNPGMSARDAVHLASMGQAEIVRIMSFDRGFDGLPGIERVH